MCVGMLHCYVCFGGDLRWWVGWLVCRPGLPILLGLLLVVVLFGFVVGYGLGMVTGCKLGVTDRLGGRSNGTYI